jgi:hypothetical protein
MTVIEITLFRRDIDINPNDLPEIIANEFAEVD